MLISVDIDLLYNLYMHFSGVDALGLENCIICQGLCSGFTTYRLCNSATTILIIILQYSSSVAMHACRKICCFMIANKNRVR